MFKSDIFRTQTIARKLLLWFLFISLVPGLFLGFIIYTTAETSIKEETLEYLQTIADSREAMFNGYIREKESDIRALAINPTIINIANEYHKAFHRGTRSREYISLEKELRNYFTDYIDEFGYYDLIFIDIDGNVFFTVKKEDVLGTNLYKGPHKDTGLAKVCKQAIALKGTSKSDYDFYIPSDQPAIFVGTVIQKEEEVIGVIALQLSNTEIYKAVQDFKDLKRTGEMVLAVREGNEAIFITPLRHDPDAAFKRRVVIGSKEALPIQKAVQRENGSGISIDYRNKEILAIWKYLPVLKWGMVLKMDADEAYQHISHMRYWTLLFGIVTILAVTLAALRISRSISAPIKELQRGSEIIGGGDLDHKVATDAEDEIGELSRAFDEMTLKLKNSRSSLEQEIIERRKTEDQLAYSEKSYRTLAENIPGIVYRVFLKENGRIKFFSKTSESLTGYKDSELKKGEICSIESRIHTEDRPAVIEKTKQAIAENRTFSCEYRFMHKDGSIRHFLEKGTPVQGDDGELLYIDGVIQDITELKMVEGALDNERERLFSLLESLPAYVYLQAPDYTIRYANNFFKEHFGDPGRKLCYDILWGNKRPCEECPTFSVFETKKPQIWEWDKSPDGRIYQVYDYPFTDIDGSSLVLELGIDITERKNAENALKQSEEKYRRYFRTVPTGWAYHKLIVNEDNIPVDYVFLEVNDAFEKLTSLKKENIIGKRVTEVLPGIEKDPADWIIKYGEVALNGKEIKFENYAEPLDRWFSVSASSPEKGYFIAIFEDITDRKKAENKLVNLNKEMEQIIQVTSHDLRTPLAVVSSYGREMERFLEGISPVIEREGISRDLKEKINNAQKEIRDTLKYIRSNIRKMDSLLNGLLRLSRSGRVELHIEDIDMNRLMDDVKSTFELDIKRSDARLEISDVPSCKGDEPQINQVFSNLLGNALKYLDPARPGIIKISGKSEYGKSVYCVEDNGMGIAPEHHEKIFEIFQQVDRMAGKGEGLGLTMVRKILDRHNGRIWLESEPGKGSRFFVSLPA